MSVRNHYRAVKCGGFSLLEMVVAIAIFCIFPLALTFVAQLIVDLQSG